MGDLLYANQTNCKREAKEGVRETVFLKRVWAAAQRLLKRGELDFLNAQKLMLAFKTVKNIHQRIARLRVRYDDGRFTQKAVICARDNLRAQQRNRLVNTALKAIQRRIQRVQRFGWISVGLSV